MANKKSLSHAKHVDGLRPTIMFLTLMFLLVATAMPIASAMEIDNVKDSIDTKGSTFNVGGEEIIYNSIWDKYAPIEITNVFGLGKILFQGAITQHTSVCGQECSSTMEIYLGEDSVLINEVDFYTIKYDGARVKQDVRNYQFKYWGVVDDYEYQKVDEEEICSQAGNITQCYINDIYDNIKVGSHDGWVNYNLGTLMPSDIYEVKLDANKKPSRSVDWVIKTQGETLTEWATWGNISSGDDGEVILISPVDNYTSLTSDVEFNCSVNVTGGAIITNVSLFTNKSGTFEKVAEVLFGTGELEYFSGSAGSVEYSSRNSTFIINGSFVYLQSFSLSESNGAGSIVTANIIKNNITVATKVTVFPSNDARVINFSESDYSEFFANGDIMILEISGGLNLRGTSTAPSLVGSLMNSTTKLPTGEGGGYRIYFKSFEGGNYTTQLFNQTILGPTLWTCQACDSDGDCGFATENRTIKRIIFGNLQTYNSTTYESAAEGFKINLTSDGSELVLADLVYDGTSYAGTKAGSGPEIEFTRNRIIPTVTIATAQNKSFYWNVTYGSEVFQTQTINQSVGRISLGLCNSTLTVPYINLTFKDEETTIATNATIDTSTWTYYLGDGTINKTLLYSTTDANESYGFCFSPSDKTVTSAVELQYSDTGYPQRRWSTSGSLTNTTSTPTLYMLASADGTYSVYQVQDTVGNGIQGVAVKVERQFAGVWTLVEQGITDSAGGFTAWLNPDYDHRITFTKSGYTTQQVIVRPSSSIYTVVMGTGGSAAAYNSSMEGLSWVVYPDLGKVIFPNTTQIFLFNITANLTNLVSCKMEVINNDSVSLGLTTGCNSQGGNLSLSIPVGENKSVRSVYSVNIGDGYFILDADAYWIIMTVNIPERGTIVAFFKHARDLNEFGSDNNRQEYSRVVFFFLMLAIIMAFLSKTTGWDLITTGGSLVFMNFIILFGSYAGFLTLSYTGVNGWMDQYVVALITSLFTVGFIFNKLGREA